MTDSRDLEERYLADDEVTTLWRMHAHRIRGWLINKQIPADLAAGMTNDAFMVVRRRWGRLRDQAPVAYAYRVAGRLALRYWEDLSKDRSLRRKLLLERSPEDEDAYAAYRDSVVLHTALAQLAPRQKEAVVLRYLKEMTVEETAARMGVAAGAVKTNTRDGLRALRALLEKADAEGGRSEPDG
ncbi:RNA polymerase sigma factor [Streptomyces sp. NPDC054796]